MIVSNKKSEKTKKELKAMSITELFDEIVKELREEKAEMGGVKRLRTVIEYRIGKIFSKTFRKEIDKYTHLKEKDVPAKKYQGRKEKQRKLGQFLMESVSESTSNVLNTTIEKLNVKLYNLEKRNILINNQLINITSRIEKLEEKKTAPKTATSKKKPAPKTATSKKKPAPKTGTSKKKPAPKTGTSKKKTTTNKKSS